MEVEFEVIPLEAFSGPQCGVYTVRLNGETEDEFTRFFNEHRVKSTKKLQRMLLRIKDFGRNGARASYFKPNEGAPGDGVVAMWIEDLRLYCIWWGTDLVLLGNGDLKFTKTWNEDPNLSKHVKLMMKVSAMIFEREQDGEMYQRLNDAGNMTFFEGNLKFLNEPE